MKALADAILHKLWLGSCKTVCGRSGACSFFPLLVIVGGIAGLLFSGSYSGNAFAQSRTAIENGAELRTLYASPEDIADGKLLAEQTCAGCHGANGVSETPTVPHLAGQRSAYLF